jgi:hypothetical protein
LRNHFVFIRAWPTAKDSVHLRDLLVVAEFH